jgi:ABC-2 type transport system permease protein
MLAERNDVAASIVIPPGFSDAVVAGREATVTIIASPDNPTSVEIARAITEGFASEVRTSQLAVATAIVATGGSPSPELIAGLSERVANGLPQAITVGAVETAVRQLDLATFFAASMSVFFLFFTVSFGVNGLLEETEQGTIRRLLAAPIRMLSIVVGKAIVSFVLGIVSMTLLVVASSVSDRRVVGEPGRGRPPHRDGRGLGDRDHDGRCRLREDTRTGRQPHGHHRRGPRNDRWRLLPVGASGAAWSPTCRT